MKEIYKGIDVSLWQSVDWLKVKAAGIDFAFIKASEGDFKDPKFLTHIEGALRAGVRAGAYHYYTATTDAELKAEELNFIAAIKPFKDKLLYAAVDVEDHKLDNMLYADRTRHIKHFCDKLAAAGFRPMVYCSSWWINNYFTPPAGVDIWEANWSIDRIPERSHILQYTAQGVVDGVSGYVDMDIARQLLGDVNGDGKINLSDVTSTLKIIAGWDLTAPAARAHADVNGDGKVNVSDAVEMLKHIRGGDNG